MANNFLQLNKSKSKILILGPPSSSVVKSSFFQLRYIAKVKQFLCQRDLETVIHAFITSRLDYCNSLYRGLPQSTINRLQVVQNAAARLLTGTKKRDHISPVLEILHWLPVKFRIDFKIAVLVYKALPGAAPTYTVYVVY